MGLKPKFSEKSGKSPPLENRAFGPDWRLLRGYRGFFGADADSSAPHSRAEIPPKGPLLARLATFGPSPCLLSPRLDFPEFCVHTEGSFCNYAGQDRVAPMEVSHCILLPSSKAFLFGVFGSFLASQLCCQLFF